MKLDQLCKRCHARPIPGEQLTYELPDQPIEDLKAMASEMRPLPAYGLCLLRIRVEEGMAGVVGRVGAENDEGSMLAGGRLWLECPAGEGS